MHQKSKVESYMSLHYQRTIFIYFKGNVFEFLEFVAHFGPLRGYKVFKKTTKFIILINHISLSIVTNEFRRFIFNLNPKNGH